MPATYQARRGGVIEVVSEKAASELLLDFNKRPGSSEFVEPEEKFINSYIQQNSKRVQSATSTSTSESSLQDRATDVKPEVTQNATRPIRHASAHRLFEINEWNENQKRIKQKRETGNSNPISSYEEIKASTQELLQDYEKLVHRSDFEAHRRREFIYRHYRCHVREPFLVAKFQQIEQIDKNRAERQRFKLRQYNQFLEFINRHKFITQEDYDKTEYDAMAQFDDSSEIHTITLTDPTLLPYHKWMNERRTLSSIGSRTMQEKVSDPRQIMSEQGFRSFHRTASTLSDGRTILSALSWKTHVQGNIDSPMRRLASAKCYHIEQKSQDPTSFDPTDRSIPCLEQRFSSAAPSVVTLQSLPPMHLNSS